MARRLIDQNPRREQRRQVLLMQRIERPLEQRLRAEIARAMREMVRVWQLTGEVQQDRDHQPHLEAIYKAMAIATVTAFGARIMDASKSFYGPIERKDFAATMTRLALGYIASEVIRRRITGVAETTRSQIVSAVARGFDDGLGQSGIADYITDLIPSISGYRADRIARTETHGAANYGSISAAAETGLRLRKEWIAAEDERTRESHDLANGDIVEQDEWFDVGGEALFYPGDPGGSAAEVINCRCTIGFIVDD